jgi:hypothetical protein
VEADVRPNKAGSGFDLGCVKTLHGMTAPGILRLVVTFREKNAEICPPLSITTKLDFVFTRPGPEETSDVQCKHLC